MTRLSQTKTAFTAVALTVVLALLLTPAPPAGGADHGDAPYGNSDQGIDGGDAFVFLDPADNTRVILQLTLRGFIAAGENNNFGQFDPAVRHRFEIETTGDARPDRFINVTFAKRTGATASQVATVTLLDGQTFTANSTGPSVCIAGAANCPPAPIITDLGTTGVRFYAGMRDDPFNFDIPAFAAGTAALRACVTASNPPTPACVAAAVVPFQRGRDSFAGYNIMTIALSIPRTALTAAGAGNSIGVQAVTQRRSPQLFPASADVVLSNFTAVGFGRWQTVDRIGNPGINAVIIPFIRKDEYNAATPQDDVNGRFAGAIVAALTALGTNSANINTLAGIVVANGDLLRLNLNTANITLGFGEQIHTPPAGGYTGFPNGRRPGDDVIDTFLFFIANQPPGGLSDNTNQNEQPLLSTFPFLSPPHQPRPGGTGAEDQTRN